MSRDCNQSVIIDPRSESGRHVRTRLDTGGHVRTPLTVTMRTEGRSGRLLASPYWPSDMEGNMADKPRFEQMQFPELIDIETLARLLGVSERYVRRMVAERRVPTVKFGHYVRFDLADIRKWIEGRRRPDAS